ncbi:MAG TPA: asparagine synthase (glutamine-hydrolyzing) [Candidatus Angelobacter sp.]|nr:asparagine synthase (glutamine-hydrolyzing) [Candidatus Angelobacter sp.]
MCGIAGFWQHKPSEEDPLHILLRMGEAIKHRGPDDSGTYFDPSTGIGFSFQRLSIIDLSQAGRQPMQSSSGRYTVVFNGEIYNFEQIRAELQPRSWRGHSDTEVMLEAIEEWGIEPAIQRFIGMFAFALWDGGNRKLYLVRDRLGIKPLYYGHSGTSFLFGSELSPIEIYPGFDSPIDQNVLPLYLRLGYVPAPHSIYKGIFKLMPGQILVLSSPEEEPHIEPYWAPDQGKNLEANRDLTDELHDQLSDAVRLRMISDVPLGAFLSGGIDSSTIVALMQSQSRRAVKTFTIGFREDHFDEAIHAQTIAKHLGTDHTELYVTGKDALSLVPSLASIYDEPFADSSQVPSSIVSRLTRQKVTVCISGDGGDELFCGYPRYARLRNMWNLVKRCPKSVGNLASNIARLLGNDKIADCFKLSSAEAIYLRAISNCSDPSEFMDGVSEPATITARIAAFRNKLPEDMAMMTDLTNYLPDDILTKIDRASMAVGLEVRVPLLDHRIVEFASRLPLHYKIRGGRGKWILRQVLKRYVPEVMFDRPKSGFTIPLDEWLRGPLREWASDLLAKPLFISPYAVQQKWREHLSGENWGNLLWSVLMFQSWLASRHPV